MVFCFYLPSYVFLSCFICQEEYKGSRLQWDILCYFDSEVRTISHSRILSRLLMIYSLRSRNYCLSFSSTVVSAGILRIFGEEIAELPLAATRIGHQGKVSYLTHQKLFVFYISLSFFCACYLAIQRNHAAVACQSIPLPSFSVGKVRIIAINFAISSTNSELNLQIERKGWV